MDFLVAIDIPFQAINLIMCLTGLYWSTLKLEAVPEDE